MVKKKLMHPNSAAKWFCPFLLELFFSPHTGSFSAVCRFLAGGSYGSAQEQTGPALIRNKIAYNLTQFQNYKLR